VVPGELVTSVPYITAPIRIDRRTAEEVGWVELCLAEKLEIDRNYFEYDVRAIQRIQLRHSVIRRTASDAAVGEMINDHAEIRQ